MFIFMFFAYFLNEIKFIMCENSDFGTIKVLKKLFKFAAINNNSIIGLSMKKTLLLLFFICSMIAGQETKTVIATGKYLSNEEISIEEGYKRAIALARANAIEQAFGISVKAESFSMKSEASLNTGIIDIFSSLNRNTVSGRIINQEIIDKKIDIAQIVTYTVKIKAEVAKETDAPDPNFILDFALNKNVFFVDKTGAGEEIKFKISANQDCYLYLFNLMSNDSVKLLMPSQILPDNFYNHKYDKQDYEKRLENINMSAGLVPGKSTLNEGLYLIALKEKIDFKSENISRDGNDIIPTYKSAIEDIQKWLLQIPNNKRTEKMQIYEIRKLQ